MACGRSKFCFLFFFHFLPVPLVWNYDLLWTCPYHGDSCDFAQPSLVIHFHQLKLNKSFPNIAAALHASTEKSERNKRASDLSILLPLAAKFYFTHEHCRDTLVITIPCSQKEALLSRSITLFGVFQISARNGNVSRHACLLRINPWYSFPHATKKIDNVLTPLDSRASRFEQNLKV